MYKVQEIIDILEKHAPLALQEDWDNCGLQVGDRSMEVTEVLCTLDVTLEVVSEAISKGCNMIVSHHPLLFGGLKTLTGRNDVEKCVIKAVKNNIAIYSAHTNMDSVKQGVSGTMADKIGLKNRDILSPQQNKLAKLVVYVPLMHVVSVRDAMFVAGAGCIGNYDQCSFSSQGEGSFRALDDSHPYVGKTGVMHLEKEQKVEVILPLFIQQKVVAAMMKAHPYEEVAYDILPLKNDWSDTGYGMIGELENEMNEVDFINKLKVLFHTPLVRHSPLLGKMIKKVAVLGGSGASYISSAIALEADVFVTADIKYHEFFIPENRIIIADIGHYESEQYTKELFKEILTKNLITFAARISETDTNKVKYS